MLMSRFRTRREIEIGLALALAVCVACTAWRRRRVCTYIVGVALARRWLWPGSPHSFCILQKMGRFELAWIITFSLFVAWSAASLAWTGDRTNGVYALERNVLYLAAILALCLAVATRSGGPATLAGAYAAIVLVATYGVANRVFPDQLGVSGDPLAAGRLFVPVGYSNAEGLAAAFGMILGVGLASRSSGKSAALAASPLPLLAAASAFTASRGALAAGVVGLLIAELGGPGRSARILRAAVMMTAWGAAFTLAYRTGNRSVDPADGRLLALELVVITVVIALAARARLPSIDLHLGSGRGAATAGVSCIVLLVVLASATGHLATAGSVVGGSVGERAPTGEGRIASVSLDTRPALCAGR